MYSTLLLISRNKALVSDKVINNLGTGLLYFQMCSFVLSGHIF